MLLPRFTIRTLLVILTLCACGFVVIGTAYRGQYWAWGVTIALVALIVTMLVHAAWFGVVWLFSHVSSMPSRPVVVPPFKVTVIAAGGTDRRHEKSVTEQSATS